MIVLTVELNQFRLEVGTDAGEYPVQVIEDFLGEHFAAISGHKDQMHMHQEYAGRSQTPSATESMFNRMP